MALQQVVTVTFVLQGDGTSTIFKYALNQMFALTMSGNDKAINLGATPTSCTAVSDLPGHITASVITGSPSKIQLVFSIPPLAGKRGSVILTLFFTTQ